MDFYKTGTESIFPEKDDDIIIIYLLHCYFNFNIMIQTQECLQYTYYKEIVK